MAKVIDMTGKNAFKMRRFERLVEENLYHSDHDVLTLWQALAKESIKKYPGVPDPGVLNVVLPSKVGQSDLDNISQNIQQYMQDYIDQVKTVMLDMLSDIIVLQKEVAEKRIEELK